MSELSDLLKRYRKLWRHPAKGNSLSQEEMNSKLGYESDIYGHWERGKRQPQAEHILKLIKIFQAGGSIKTLDEANALLDKAGFKLLKPDELEILADAPPPQLAVSTPVDPGLGPALRAEPTICRVFDNFPDEEFSNHVRQGKQIRILTTWIPYLEMFFEALSEALHAGAQVEILMLHPVSPAAELRSLAISAPGGIKRKDRVQKGVHSNLAMLADAAKALSSTQERRLQVRVYHSLPSVLLYQVDTFCLAGFYFHGRMASYTPQLQVNQCSLLGQTLQEEFETLWTISHPIENLANWSHELEQLAKEF